MILFVFHRLFKEMYTIAPHVERLEDSRKSLHATVLVSCQVRRIYNACVFVLYITSIGTCPTCRTVSANKLIMQ